jgi:hypothetical protein
MKSPFHHDNSTSPMSASDELPELDARVQGLLGRALQSHYDDLVNAPVPDRFLMLLAELEAAEQAGIVATAKDKGDE